MITVNQTYNNDHCRIDYLDILKGFTILWIVWYHQPHPNIVGYYYHVPLFFFISGIFFKHIEFKDFLKGVAYKIIIPFFFFYIISYFFQLTRYIFENSTVSGFNWIQIIDFLKLDCKVDYLLVNRPLWFLISLSVIKVIYYIISRLPKYLILIICAAIILLKEPLLATKSPFMINQSIYWLVYFAIGDIFGKGIVFHKIPNKWKLYAIITCIIIYTSLCFCTPLIALSILKSISYEIMVFSFILLCIFIFSFFKGGTVIARFLRFYGQNSLSVLGLHLPISIILGGISYRLFGITGNLLVGFSIFILTAIILYPIILLINRFLPFCVGKRVLN